MNPCAPLPPARRLRRPAPHLPPRLAWAALGLVVALLPFPLSAQADPAPVPPPALTETPRTLAILYFENHTGAARYDPLGKGLAEMLITDLSSISRLRVVERARLQELADEVAFSRSAHADEATALAAGRFLSASYVVTGAMTSDGLDLRVDSRLLRTETGEVLSTSTARGGQDRFFELQEQVADGLLAGLEMVLSEEEAALLAAEREANRIDDAETALAFSQALDLYDRGQYVDALERLAFVRRRAPASRIVSVTTTRVQEDAAAAAVDEGRDRVNTLIRGILRRGGGGN